MIARTAVFPGSAPCHDAAPPPLLVALAAVACDRLVSEFAEQSMSRADFDDSGTGSDMDEEFDVTALLRKPNLLSATIAPLSPFLVTCFTPAAMYPPLLDSLPLAADDARSAGPSLSNMAAPPTQPSAATHARLRTRSLSFHPYHVAPAATGVGAGWRARAASVSAEGATRCSDDSRHIDTEPTTADSTTFTAAAGKTEINVAPPASLRLRPRTARHMKEQYRQNYQHIRRDSACSNSVQEDDASTDNESDESAVETPSSDSDDELFSPRGQAHHHALHASGMALGVSSGRKMSASSNGSSISTSSTSPSASSSTQQHKHVVKPRANFPHDVLSVLTGWLQENKDNPYPTMAEKTKLGRACGLNMKQVNNWFINARRRRI
ncbi:hypothetical protein HDU83_004932 [Entophlyctis luteolus]|nr:hypothetical protein HDU82_000161 [Entophlyctis luteolus]KAJ3344699.1 hypothetical protein HDU83_004932 [Entophlyctis luteolus]